MKAEESSHVKTLPEPLGNRVRSAGVSPASPPGVPPGVSAAHADEKQDKNRFRDVLLRWLSCPELAKDSQAAARSGTNMPEPPGRPQPRKSKWPEPKGRAPKFGDGRKVTVQSADDFCAASFRIADFGLLVESTFRIWNFQIRFTTDGLSSWLVPSKS